jgi:hypothetical protein
MKYLTKILNLSWLNTGGGGESISNEDPRDSKEDLMHDISIAKLEDDGSVYLLCLDWSRREIQECQQANFFEPITQSLPNSTVQIINGQLGGDIEVVETSVAEVFEREEE